MAGSDVYYPPPESKGGWRYLADAAEIERHAGMDAAGLDRAMALQDHLYGGDSWAMVIIRRGYLVREHATFNVSASTRFDAWSCTKSFTDTAFGLLLDDSRRGALGPGKGIDLDSPAYEFIPEGYPLTDPRKEGITIGHLLTMSSSIPGESLGLWGMPMKPDQGAFEHALGRSPNRYGRMADRLAAEPGTRWDYSDPAFAHLSLIFAHVAGREVADYLQERVFDPIGIENLSWDVQGGRGHLGPHTNAHSGVHISAGELARFGYLALRGGQWLGEQIIPQWWHFLSTQTSQPLNPSYGYTWWVNSKGTNWPDLPRDAFALSGFRCNRCYVIPSLDLVVARVGTGPVSWDDGALIGDIAAAITDWPSRIEDD